VRNIKGGTQTEGVGEGAEENIWTKGDEVMGGWKKLHNEDLRNLYCSASIIRIINRR
jgi:hypothetical protein